MVSRKQLRVCSKDLNVGTSLAGSHVVETYQLFHTAQHVSDDGPPRAERCECGGRIILSESNAFQFVKVSFVVFVISHEVGLADPFGRYLVSGPLF